MSVEYMEAEHAVETVVDKEPSVENKHPRHAKKLGKRALELDGFMMLEAVDSPFEDIRKKLESKVIDQQPAIDAILDAIDRVSVRLADDHRPIANLAFLGPTGVGKSETAKTLAALTSKAGNLIKLDCSNYSHGHEVTALVGSPPSYVGHNQEPHFAKERVEVPGTVVLFDEIEKGSPALYNLMLQIMGDGQLRLNNGETVSFRDTVIVITSNLGAKEMSTQLSANPLGFAKKDRPTDKENLEQVAKKSFTEFFSPEFTNRLDKLVVFHPLSEEGLSKVLDVKLAEANNHYEKKFGVRISLSEATRSHLVSIAASEPHLGARPLIRALEDNVQSTFGRYNKTGMLPEGTHVRVVHRNEVADMARPSGDSPFVFTAKPDRTIRKEAPPLELTAAEKEYVDDDDEFEDPADTE